MDFLQDILKEKSGDLIAELTGKADFSTEQAETFLPEAGSSVGKAMMSRASELDLGNLASAANVGAIMKGVDLAGLASKVGVSAEQSTNGLSAFLPMLLGFIGDKGKGAGGLLALLAAKDGADGALGMLKGLGGKLFK